ncbi:MAG: hypothetical protein NZ993_06615 [Bacteroidetes bacterium]|nr:hypothetical protein [Bacteroidota bacterium]
MESFIRFGLALLFVGYLADMPYDYYEAVRCLGMMGFVYLAFQAGEEARQRQNALVLGGIGRSDQSHHQNFPRTNPLERGRYSVGGGIDVAVVETTFVTSLEALWRR